MGGETPTITDANVLLGYINPAHLVGGALKLNAEKARAVFAEKIAKPLGMTLERAAYGAHLIAASNMIRAIKAVSTERGRDPREFALFAFGGNGPLFAAGMAAALGITRIVVPPSAGLFSSFGLLYADVEHHYARTFRRLLRQADLGEIDRRVGRTGATGERATRRGGIHAASMPGSSARPRCITRAKATSSSCRCPTGRSTHAWWRISRKRSARSTSGPTATAPALRSLSSWSRSSLSAPGCATAKRAAIRCIEPAGGGRATARSAYFGAEHGWLDTPVIDRARSWRRPRSGRLSSRNTTRPAWCRPARAPNATRPGIS